MLFLNNLGANGLPAWRLHMGRTEESRWAGKATHHEDEGKKEKEKVRKEVGEGAGNG